MSGLLWTAFKIVIISVLIYWFFIEYIDYTPKNKQFIEKFSTQVADRILQKLSFHGETEEDIKPIDLEKVNKEREAQILDKNINEIESELTQSELVEPEIMEEEKTDDYFIKTKLKTIPNQLPPILKVEGEDSSERKIPNQTNLVDEYHKLDNGVLYSRNFENPKLLSMYQELTLSQVTPLISKVVINNHNNAQDINEEIEQYKKTIDTWKREKDTNIFTAKIDKMKMLLMQDINKVIEASKLTTKYHSYINYQIKNFNLVHQTYSEDKKYINLEGAIHIYRKNRIRYFTLHFNIIIPNINQISITASNYYINELKIVGVKTLPIIDKNKTEKTDLKFLQDRTLGELMSDREGGDFKCFHPKGQNGELPNYTNKLDCISYHKEVDGVGVWDEPCKSNNECPFYQANQNYDNQFGGCILGQCQLPTGLDKVGYRHWNKLTQPYCHQCNLVSDKTSTSISDKQCCNQQKEAIETEEISLKTPDYIFDNDSNLRNI
jgi:hypothetical protein